MKRWAIATGLLIALLTISLLLFTAKGRIPQRKPDELIDFSSLQTAPKPSPHIGRLTTIAGSNAFFVSGPALPLARVRVDGTVLWQAPLDQTYSPRIQPGPQGSFYLGQRDMQLGMPVISMLDASYQELWKQPIVIPLQQADVQTASCEHKLVVGIEDKLWMIDEHNATLWGVDQLPDLQLLEHCGSGSEVIATCSTRGLVCYSPQGQLLWSSGNPQHSLLGVKQSGASDWVLVLTPNTAEAYDLTGKQLWSRPRGFLPTAMNEAWLLGDCALLKQDWRSWECLGRNGKLRFTLQTVGDMGVDALRDQQGRFYLLYLNAAFQGYSTFTFVMQRWLHGGSTSNSESEARLLCLNPDGKTLWESSSAYLPSGPWLLPDGNVAVARGLEMMIYHTKP